MFRSLFRRIAKQKFFNRLLMTYTFIIVITIMFLSAMIIRDIERSTELDAKYGLEQAVQSVKDYLTLKENTVKILTQQMYLNPNQSQDMMDFLMSKPGDLTIEDINKTKLIINFLNAAASQDNDIYDALLYKTVTEELFVYSKDLTIHVSDSLENNEALYHAMNDSFYGLRITPTYNQRYSNYERRLIFTIAANVRGSMSTNNFSKSIGVLQVNFNTHRIASYFSNQFKGKFHPNVLVLTKDDQAIIDTTNRYYGVSYPYADQVKKQQSGSRVILEESSIMSSSYLDDLDVYIIAALPSTQISASTTGTRNTVIIVAIISALLSTLLGSMSTLFFSRRIKLINKAIQKVQIGDFKYRIKIGNAKDEISSIAANFNQMCDMLIDYINKVYKSELRQKDAELHALQSQINPHFLYNTLEVIRMEALAAGAEGVNRMIEILAQLFRGSIKGGLIVELKEEFGFCRNYLELYNLRYAGQLHTEFHIDPNIQHYGILKHLLQPIIENAILYGIQHNKSESHITVRGYKKNEIIIIEVSDNGVGIDSEQLEALNKMLASAITSNKSSIGLSNVNHRIRLFFGEPYRLEVESEKGVGTTVRIRIPAETKKEMLLHVQSFAGG